MLGGACLASLSGKQGRLGARSVKLGRVALPVLSRGAMWGSLFWGEPVAHSQRRSPSPARPEQRWAMGPVAAGVISVV